MNKKCTKCKRASTCWAANKPIEKGENFDCFVLMDEDYKFPDGGPCEHCRRGRYTFSRYCGAYVCDECSNHQGLARCFCGWSTSGSDGRRELEAMGEVIEPEDY